MKLGVLTFWPTFDAPFWQAFWANALANFLVGILLAAVISWLIVALRRADAQVVADIRQRQSGASSNQQRAQFDVAFSISNAGRVAFSSEEVYWHVFLNSEELRPVFQSVTDDKIKESRSVQKIEGVTFEHYHGLLEGPVFAGHQQPLFTIRSVPKRGGRHCVYYYLTTAKGLFPRSVRRDQSGKVILSRDSLGCCELLFPDVTSSNHDSHKE